MSFVKGLVKGVVEDVRDNSIVNKAIFRPPQPPEYSPYDFGENLVWVPREDERLPSFIPTLVYPFTGAQRLIIYFHANAEDLDGVSSLLRHYGSAWGAHTVAFEYSGYGWSGRTHNENNINNDARRIFKFVTEELKVPSNRVVLFGRSIGCGPVCKLAADLSREEVELGGIILQSGFVSVNAIANDYVKEYIGSAGVGGLAAGLMLERWNNEKEAKSITCPAILLHGKADTVIPYQQSERVYEALASQYRDIVLPPYADHDTFELETQVLLPILEFLDLATRTQRPSGKEMREPGSVEDLVWDKSLSEVPQSVQELRPGTSSRPNSSRGTRTVVGSGMQKGHKFVGDALKTSTVVAQGGVIAASQSKTAHKIGKFFSKLTDKSSRAMNHSETGSSDGASRSEDT